MPGKNVNLFSCGGRADGGGQVTDSQLFPFSAGETSLEITPQNQINATCLVPDAAILGNATCTGDVGQRFTIVQ